MMAQNRCLTNIEEVLRNSFAWSDRKMIYLRVVGGGAQPDRDGSAFYAFVITFSTVRDVSAMCSSEVWDGPGTSGWSRQVALLWGERMLAPGNERLFQVDLAATSDEARHAFRFDRLHDRVAVPPILQHSGRRKA